MCFKFIRLCIWILFFSYYYGWSDQLEYTVNLVNIERTAVDNKNLYIEERNLFDCSQLDGVSSGQQKYCYLYQDHMDFVGRGIKAGLSECKSQFKHHKWNCTVLDEDNFLGPNLQINNRETAFVKAILAAGVVHSISRACKEGQLITCGCSKDARPRNLQKDWMWGGCSDNMKYAYKFVEEFLDIKERGKSHKKATKEQARSLANLHNNEAGRRAVSKNAHVSCKCHGVSGSCSLVTCWQQLPTMKEIGDYLKIKYDAATRVKINRRGRLQIKDPTLTVPSVNDLVYVDESPNYCLKNITAGSIGTQNRICNKTTTRSDGCNLLCCGRGYSTIRSTVKERCNCKFQWCCHVECDICTKTTQISFCK